ncbi:MAG: hypothetical protein DA405_06925 [Bacteroidetes bacterium]|nr:MAG: hypothetical protein DA405_06925 [Bacteroidota bacterium]
MLFIVPELRWVKNKYKGVEYPTNRMFIARILGVNFTGNQMLTGTIARSDIMLNTAYFGF